MKTKATFLMLLAISTSNAQESSTETGETPESTEVTNLLRGSAAEESEPEESEPEQVEEAGPTLEVTVALKNGITLTGTVSQSDLLTWAPGADLSFTPTGGTASTLAGANIASVTQAGAVAAPAPVTVNVTSTPEKPKEPENTYRSPNGFRHPNPAASRYLYAPSAINMKAGQGYISQKYVFTSLAYAPTDNFTMLFGTFTFFPPALSIFGGKYSFEINENIKASIGGEAFVTGLEDQSVLVAIGFGAITFGNEDKHLTVATGYAGGEFFDAPQLPLMVAGQVRTDEGIALVTENWLLFDVNNIGNGDINNVVSAHINSIAIRLVGRRDRGDGVVRGMRTREGHPKTTWDLGFAAFGVFDTYTVYNNSTGQAEPTEIREYYGLGPMPWIDWTWHFGEAKN